MNTMNKLYGLFLATAFLCLASPSLSFAGASKDITVSAAMSLKNAFEQIGRLYESRHGIKVIFNFGASGTLAIQISGGAPVDVFASASQKEMDDIEKKKCVMPGTRVDFANNSIALIVPSNSKIPLRSFEDLKSDKIKRIAIGNPKTVPAGRYAAEVLEYFNLSTPLHNKLIFAEHVRQVLDYVARGEVDAGIVYATDAAFSKTDTKVVTIAPEVSHSLIIYPISVVQGTRSEAAANAFIKLVLSDEARKILLKHGFRPVK